MRRRGAAAERATTEPTEQAQRARRENSTVHGHHYGPELSRTPDKAPSAGGFSYTRLMPLDIPAVQRALEQDDLDGWLLYDFQGSNPIATRLSGLASSGKMTTRRWYYLIPASGEPRGLVHAIERYNLDGLPRLEASIFRARAADGRTDRSSCRVCAAWRWSTRRATPSRTCRASMQEPSRRSGAGRRGRLLRRSHPAVRGGLERRGLRHPPHRVRKAVPDQGQRVRPDSRADPIGNPVTEFEVQQKMVEWFKKEGLTSHDPPNVSAQENAGNPHYNPTREHSRAIRPGRARPDRPLGQARRPGRGVC